MRFTTVPFGIISSPFLLTATIQYHMSSTNKIQLKEIAAKCYVDNLVTCTKTTEQAQTVYCQTEETLSNFNDHWRLAIKR